MVLLSSKGKRGRTGGWVSWFDAEEWVVVQRKELVGYWNLCYNVLTKEGIDS